MRSGTNQSYFTKLIRSVFQHLPQVGEGKDSIFKVNKANQYIRLIKSDQIMGITKLNQIMGLIQLNQIIELIKPNQVMGLIKSIQDIKS